MQEIDEQAIVDKLLAAEQSSGEQSSQPKEQSTSDAGDKSQEAKADTGTVPDKQETKGEASQTSEEPKDDGTPVSYKRFRQIWARSKELERKTTDYEAELAELRQLRQQTQTTPSKQTGARQGRDKIDDLIDEVMGTQEEPDPIEQVRGEVRAMRVERETERLEAEVSAASKEFPEVPAKYLLQAVIQNPKINVREEASRIAAHLAAYETQILAKHAKTQTQSQSRTPPTAPPDLSNTRQTGNSGQGQKVKYKDYDDLEANVLRQLGIS